MVVVLVVLMVAAATAAIIVAIILVMVVVVVVMVVVMMIAVVVVAVVVVKRQLVCWLLACLTSQQHANVSQGRICSDHCTCCHTEIEVAGQTFHPTQSQYADTRPTSPSADPLTSGAWRYRVSTGTGSARCQYTVTG